MIPVYTMVGAGGTGSILLDPLVRLLRSHHGNDPFIVAVIDGDVVEAKNLSRQRFTDDVLHQNKAVALVDLTHDHHLRAVPEFLGDANLEDRIRDGDTVLICADNYDVRRRIEARALQLDNVTVINGGNEESDGSVQTFIRRGGVNMTPPLSLGHPEILQPSPFDPTILSCQERAALPGGGQTIVANMMSAAFMLNELRSVLDGEVEWHELYFDLTTRRARPALREEIAA